MENGNNNLLVPNWPAPANVAAYTTLRNFDPAYFQQLPTPPKWLKQVHGTTVAHADTLNIELPEADASVAYTANTVCVVRTADCLPILLCDQAGTQIAAIHAGWRGLAAGIITQTINSLTADPSQCLAWIGPAISAQAFEVGSDVPEAFLAYGWEPVHIQHAFVAKPNTPGKFMGDLVYLARQVLQQHGIPAANIYGGEWCTHSDPARFFSFRRSAEAGRMATLIWLK